MKKQISILILFFATTLFVNVQAQDDCSVVLREAQDTYDAGNLDEVILMIYPCLETGFNKSEKIQAYRLIALTFLFDDKVGEARAAMYELLKIDPEFEYNEAIDPIEFKELHNEFKTFPLYSLGVNGGVNLSQINLLETYDVDNYNENTSSYVSNGLGYQFGIHSALIIKQKLYANLGFLLKGTKYMYDKKYNFNGLTNSSDTLRNFGNLNSQENQTWLNIPVSLTYDIPIKGNFSTYARLGFSTAFLFRASSKISRTYEDKYSLPEVTGGDVDMTANRTKTNFWLTGGTGIKYKVTKGNLFIDVRYNYGLKYANNALNRYNNQELLYKYYYIDDDFKINDLAISVGYTRHFYNPTTKDKSNQIEKNSSTLSKSKSKEKGLGKAGSKDKGTRYKKFK